MRTGLRADRIVHGYPNGEPAGWESCSFAASIARMFPTESEAAHGVAGLYEIMMYPGKVRFNKRDRPRISSEGELACGSRSLATTLGQQMADKKVSKQATHKYEFVPVINELLLRNSKLRLVALWPAEMDHYFLDEATGNINSWAISTIARQLSKDWASHYGKLKTFYECTKSLNSPPKTGASGPGGPDGFRGGGVAFSGSKKNAAEICAAKNIFQGKQHNSKEIMRWMMVMNPHPRTGRLTWQPLQAAVDANLGTKRCEQVPFAAGNISVMDAFSMFERDGPDPTRGSLVVHSLGAPGSEDASATAARRQVPAPVPAPEDAAPLSSAASLVGVGRSLMSSKGAPDATHKAAEEYFKTPGSINFGSPTASELDGSYTDATTVKLRSRTGSGDGSSTLNSPPTTRRRRRGGARSAASASTSNSDSCHAEESDYNGETQETQDTTIADVGGGEAAVARIQHSATSAGSAGKRDARPAASKRPRTPSHLSSGLGTGTDAILAKSKRAAAEIRNAKSPAKIGRRFIDLTSPANTEDEKSTSISKAIFQSGKNMCASIDGAASRMADAMLRSGQLVAGATSASFSSAQREQTLVAAGAQPNDLTRMKQSIVLEVKEEIGSQLAQFSQQLQQLQAVMAPVIRQATAAAEVSSSSSGKKQRR